MAKPAETMRGVAAFTAVADAGSFSAAARALGLSKSAVSKQVARLEDRLRVRLVNRTTRRLALTEEGRAFAERCRRILAEIEEAELAVRRLQSTPRGTLRVNAPMSFGVAHFAPLLPAFLERYPEVAVELVLNDRVVDLVEEGFDLAVRIVRLADSSLIARRLAPFRRVVCAAPEYWRRRGRPRRPADLAGHECLRYSYLSTVDEWPFIGPQGAERVRVRGRLSVNNGDALRIAAVAGLGVCLAPTFIVGEEIAAGRLEVVLADYEERDLAIYAVYPSPRHLSAKVRAFVDFLAAAYARPSWLPGP